MKHTKSMIYNPTTESNELFIYATNDGFLYEHQTKCIVENLRKKAKKGLYDSEKAVDLYYNLATNASNKYFKDFGYKFSVSDRYTVAVDLEAYYQEDVYFELDNN